MSFNPTARVVFGLLLAVQAASGQWLNYKAPGLPRTPDGNVNLSASAPRASDGKPDLSGVWRPDRNAGADSKASELPKFQPWAEGVAQKRQQDLLRDDPGTLCLPMGPVVSMGVGKIVQTPGLLLMLYNGTLYREIFLDGRELPKDPNPDWMGYSVGRWEGDTLVVESNGYNDRTWLDDDGHPHTEALRLTERYRRSDLGHMEVRRTYDDPGALLSPWNVTRKFELDDVQPLEYVCNENERDRSHMIGKASDIKSVILDQALLSQYAGAYEFRPPDRPDLPITINVVLDDGRLSYSDGGSTPSVMTPISPKEFAFTDGTQVEFFKGDDGVVSHLVAHTVEGDLKAVRRKSP